MMQIELMKILLEHPDVRPRSPIFDPGKPAQHRRDVYTNLIYRYLEYGYEIDYLPDEAVYSEMVNQFSVPDVRRWWELARDAVGRAAIGERRRRFFEIVQAAFEASAERPAVPAPPEPVPPVADRRRRVPLVVRAGGAAVVVLAVACGMRRRGGRVR